jgi:hypothetical protein
MIEYCTRCRPPSPIPYPLSPILSPISDPLSPSPIRYPLSSILQSPIPYPLFSILYPLSPIPNHLSPILCPRCSLATNLYPRHCGHACPSATRPGYPLARLPHLSSPEPGRLPSAPGVPVVSIRGSSRRGLPPPLSGAEARGRLIPLSVACYRLTPLGAATYAPFPSASQRSTALSSVWAAPGTRRAAKGAPYI